MTIVQSTLCKRCFPLRSTQISIGKKRFLPSLCKQAFGYPVIKSVLFKLFLVLPHLGAIKIQNENTFLMSNDKDVNL